MIYGDRLPTNSETSRGRDTLGDEVVNGSTEPTAGNPNSFEEVNGRAIRILERFADRGFDETTSTPSITIPQLPISQYLTERRVRSIVIPIRPERTIGFSFLPSLASFPQPVTGGPRAHIHPRAGGESHLYINRDENPFRDSMSFSEHTFEVINQYIDPYALGRLMDMPIEVGHVVWRIRPPPPDDDDFIQGDSFGVEGPYIVLERIGDSFRVLDATGRIRDRLIEEEQLSVAVSHWTATSLPIPLAHYESYILGPSTNELYGGYFNR